MSGDDTSKAARLAELNRLHTEGDISDADYELLRADILGQSSQQTPPTTRRPTPGGLHLILRANLARGDAFILYRLAAAHDGHPRRPAIVM
ncbi:MAG TPA: hypothetical protein VFD53_00370 [Ilumatobacter sp.]|jgi:hypothetical protein|nr:hypothetical protein [Ilumatobacter sp.]